MNMEYEVVELEPKTVVGIEARTNNMSPDLPQVIGGLWSDFYGKGIYESIDNKVSGKSLGIYTDYAGNEKDDYTLVVACETDQSKINHSETDHSGADQSKSDHMPNGMVQRTIPGGKYAKFIVQGDQKTAVGQFWGELWKMQLNRSYVCDFEEYQNSDCENALVHIYIGLTE